MSRALPILALAALACAANPRPGEPGYAYNVNGTYQASFTVDGNPYAGTLEATTAPGGAVAGSFRVTGEVTASASFAGTVVGDSLTWTGAYTLAEVDCPGTISSSGVVAEGGASLAGDLFVVGCDQTYEGIYTASR
ncbi:MAG TPA: hypothetical protein VM778_11535 [Gemmatimonadota bacterium]|nr:hypothetical protein [Gemmatimonadota bacterium]